ncbi:hypothetical protein SUGI_0466130 [Cryptomeria japonica]|nr:hypothetical protein SUGI_0466130 [Cryptomeria japonica]
MERSKKRSRDFQMDNNFTAEEMEAVDALLRLCDLGWFFVQWGVKRRNPLTTHKELKETVNLFRKEHIEKGGRATDENLSGATRMDPSIKITACPHQIQEQKLLSTQPTSSDRGSRMKRFFKQES